MSRRHHQTRSTPILSLPKIKTNGKETKEKKPNKYKKRFKSSKRIKTPSIKHWSSSLNPIHCDPVQKAPPSSAYIIKSAFHDNILTIHVYDTISNKRWRQQFTQNSFKSIKIYTIAKTLIKSIKHIENTAATKHNVDDEKETIEFRPLQIKIFEHSEFCYITLLDSKFPTFALRPIPPHASLPPLMNRMSSKPHINIRQFKPRKQSKHPLSIDVSFVSNKWNARYSPALSPSAGVHSIEGMSSENTTSTWTQSTSEWNDNEDNNNKEPGSNDSFYKQYNKVTDDEDKNTVQYGFV